MSNLMDMSSVTKAHFQELSKLLDEKNDKYERIYKANRDVTYKSKRVIFSLQRLPGLSNPERATLLLSASDDLKMIESTLLKFIAQELDSVDASEFLHAYTGGIQEYIEAVSFYHFLQTDQILSYQDIQRRVTFQKSDTDISITVVIPVKEYMLGLADLTGELMRLCIKSIGVGDFAICYKISDILKQMKAGFTSLGSSYPKELQHKVGVFNSSLAKVEDACYSLQLRKSELPPEMLAHEVSMSDLEYSLSAYI